MLQHLLYSIIYRFMLLFHFCLKIYFVVSYIFLYLFNKHMTVCVCMGVLKWKINFPWFHHDEKSAAEGECKFNLVHPCFTCLCVLRHANKFMVSGCFIRLNYMI